VEVPETNEGGWTEEGLAGAVLMVAAGAAAAWEAAGSVRTGLVMIRCNSRANGDYGGDDMINRIGVVGAGSIDFSGSVSVSLCQTFLR
jgi:hypothetical protein